MPNSPISEIKLNHPRLKAEGFGWRLEAVYSSFTNLCAPAVSRTFKTYASKEREEFIGQHRLKFFAWKAKVLNQ